MSLTMAPPRAASQPKLWHRPPDVASQPLPPPPKLGEMPRDRNVVIPMSREQWWEYPFEGRSEWANGEAILMPPLAPIHSFIQSDMLVALANALPGARVVAEYGVDRVVSYRVPDLCILARRPDPPRAGEQPAAVVEIVSPSSRRIDRIDKMSEYLDKGIGQYWIVDPVAETVEVLANERRLEWRRLAVLDADHPVLDIEVADLGTARLQHEQIFQ